MLRAVRHLLGVAAFQGQVPKKFPLAAVGPWRGSNFPGQLSPALLTAKGRASSTSGTRTAKPHVSQLCVCSVWVGTLAHQKDKATLVNIKKKKIFPLNEFFSDIIVKGSVIAERKNLK